MFDFFFKKVAFWRSYGFLDVMGRCASTNDPRSFDYQLYMTFRRGVKVVHTVFEVVFGPKRTSTIWLNLQELHTDCKSNVLQELQPAVLISTLLYAVLVLRYRL